MKTWLKWLSDNSKALISDLIIDYGLDDSLYEMGRILYYFPFYLDDYLENK